MPNETQMTEQTMDGLWTAEFGSSAGVFGGGVATLREGTITGGDGTYFYLGNYQLRGRAFHAVLRVSPFIDGAESVFKTTGRNLTLELTGSLTPDGQVIAQGTPREVPNVRFAVKLTRRS
jgi:hypothetical protein